MSAVPTQPNDATETRRRLPFTLPAPRLATIHEASAALHLSRSGVYNLLRKETLTAVKIGNRTFIRTSDLETYLAALPAATFRPEAR